MLFRSLLQRVGAAGSEGHLDHMARRRGRALHAHRAAQHDQVGDGNLLALLRDLGVELGLDALLTCLLGLRSVDLICLLASLTFVL